MEVNILLLQRDLQGTLRGLADAGIIHLRQMATADVQAKTVAGFDQHLIERYASFKSLLQHIRENLDWKSPETMAISLPSTILRPGRSGPPICISGWPVCGNDRKNWESSVTISAASPFSCTAWSG